MSPEAQIAALVINAMMVLLQSGVLAQLKSIRADLHRILDPQTGELAKMNKRIEALEGKA